MDYVTFSIIIDDIVFPIGETRMGVLGGGGPQAAFGMCLWSESVGLVSGVGYGLPSEAHGWFEECGIDLTGLRYSAQPPPRAWQVLEEDGSRRQVWRVPGEVVRSHLSRRLEDLPEAYRYARGYHLGIHPLEPDLDFLYALRDLDGLLSVEPFRQAERPPTPIELRELVEVTDIFSPNLVEASSLVGEGEPLDLVRRLFDAGASVVSLRMGADGALVADRESGRALQVPALRVRVIDPVGAGNAFCGGFLVGWSETHDLLTAGLYGAVAGSFLVEQVGIPMVTEAVREEARQRFQRLRTQVEELAL